MRIALSFVFVLVSSVSGLAQAKASVKVEPLMSGGYSVTAKHPAFKAMCQDLAKKVGAESDAANLRVMPKALLQSRKDQTGEVWTVGSRGKLVEVRSNELPYPLWSVRGMVADLAYLGTCYLRDNYFYNTEEMSFILEDQAAAEAFARLFR
jgi:hypothetical protein